MMFSGEKMTDFDKLKTALGSYKIVRKFEEKLLLGCLHLDGGQLDYRRYKTGGAYLDELKRMPDFRCVVVFPGAGVPPIKCRFIQLLECFNYALAVSPCMWIIDSRSRIIDFSHGMATICVL